MSASTDPTAAAAAAWKERDAAYSQATPHSIQGLFNLHAAAAILRIERSLGGLDATVVSDHDGGQTQKQTQTLDAFFEQLSELERTLAVKREQKMTHNHNDKTVVQSRVIAVEGLDGCGKTSLVEALTKQLQQSNDNSNGNGRTAVIAEAWSTPTASMKAVRPVFDKRGGAVARAFYMVSNYMLQYELEALETKMITRQQQQSTTKPTLLVIVVDRWYTSTVAYSAAWKNTQGGPEAIDALERSLFAWPDNLRPPDLLFLLHVDNDVRRNRVQGRASTDSGGGGASRFNPWDDRLDKDENLGRRILRALERVGESLSSSAKNSSVVVILDANKSQQKVLEDAWAKVQTHLFGPKQQQGPSPLHDLSLLQDNEKRSPLDLFVAVSSRWGLCDPSRGRRLRHQPWALQLSWNQHSTANSGSTVTESSSPSEQSILPVPVLKTVGIHTVNKSGILMFTRYRPEAVYASFVCVGGEYPHEQQWRGEGWLCPLTMSECKRLGSVPPESLKAWTLACQQHEKEQDRSSPGTTSATTSTEVAYPRTCLEAPEQLQDLARSLRHDNNLRPSDAADETEPHQSLQATLIVPLRMEVLIGGPSSPGGPRRYEWLRGLASGSSSTNNTDLNYDQKSGWSRMRPILPFGSGPSIAAQPGRGGNIKPITLAITGAHCSGKATLGHMLAATLGWPFQEELGAVLRDQSHLAPGGHRVGDGSGCSNALKWDNRIYAEEVKRDEESRHHDITSRIVETWHVGNLSWALSREVPDIDAGREWQRIQAAIKSEMETSCVLAVHLEVSSPDVLLRRRKADAKNVTRLPMENETEECQMLYQHHNVSAKGNLKKLQDELDFQALVLDNSEDGDASKEEAVRKIVTFIHEHQWRRCF